jgi:ABC-type transporter Mla subunit MlaD
MLKRELGQRIPISDSSPPTALDSAFGAAVKAQGDADVASKLAPERENVAEALLQGGQGRFRQNRTLK